MGTARGMGGTGQRRTNGKHWDNFNGIINNIYFKKKKELLNSDMTVTHSPNIWQILFLKVIICFKTSMTIPALNQSSINWETQSLEFLAHYFWEKEVIKKKTS